MLTKWHGNVWFQNEQNQNEFYDVLETFKKEAIEGIGGMTMNERLYWFGLFDLWDNSDEDDKNRIRNKLHAKA
jgi:hypothetical protein